VSTDGRTESVGSTVTPQQGSRSRVTDGERRTITEMMAKGSYAIIMPATADVADVAQYRAGVRRSRLRRPRSRGWPDPHPGAALNRAAMAATNLDVGTVRR
jgi:hypothetical protein